MTAGAAIAPRRPQPVPQPMPELRQDVGNISAAAM
eukprot:CAMPEP_0115827764 /NCGR_PEP_ID=MMETSP0287-20121206/215_1 /TAXON_ID=412157 /ORGANISM="Chrysochromulina rotalis, Strain UIO044" /LENGTH=34 /DNA_ID= /DNA_START= /DNA_END= /DNA_ORIENTATION=